MSDEEKISLEPVYKSKTYCIHENPYAYATCTNFQRGKGMIAIHSDWGAYSTYWGSMGDSTIEEFLLSCNSEYIERNLHYQMNYMGCKKEAFVRLTKFMAHCWPRLREVIKAELEREKHGLSNTVSERTDAQVAP